MSSFVDSIMKFGKPGRNVEKTDVSVLHKIAMVCTVVLRDAFQRFIKAHASEALLFQYSCDSTPIMLSESCSTSVDMWRVIRRCKVTKHLIAERAFVVNTKGDCRILFGPPRDLADCTAWSHFASFQRLTDYHRQQTHVGLLHCHHVWDRAVKSACERHHLQWWLACEDLEASKMSGGESHRLWCTSFFTAVGCFLHDLHNGFKRSIATFIKNPSTMRSMWICLESARSSFSLLAKVAGEWLTCRLAFEAWDNAHLAELWETLGFRDEWLALLVNLEIRFSAGRLRVSPRYSEDPRLPSLVTTVLLKVWV